MIDAWERAENGAKSQQLTRLLAGKLSAIAAFCGTQGLLEY
jgi:hypothetical protein